MRYKVEYTYGKGSYGDRLFDIPEEADEQAVRKAAMQVIPASTTIVKIAVNDGEDLLIR